MTQNMTGMGTVVLDAAIILYWLRVIVSRLVALCWLLVHVPFDP